MRGLIRPPNPRTDRWILGRGVTRGMQGDGSPRRGNLQSGLEGDLGRVEQRPGPIEQQTAARGTGQTLQQAPPMRDEAVGRLVGERVVKTGEDGDDSDHDWTSCSSMSRRSCEAGPVRLCWMQRL